MTLTALLEMSVASNADIGPLFLDFFAQGPSLANMPKSDSLVADNLVVV